MDAIVNAAGEKVTPDDHTLEKKPSLPRIGVFGGLLVENVEVEARECIDSVTDFAAISCWCNNLFRSVSIWSVSASERDKGDESRRSC